VSSLSASSPAAPSPGRLERSITLWTHAEGPGVGHIGVSGKAHARPSCLYGGGATAVTVRHLATPHGRATGHTLPHYPALASREMVGLLVGRAIGAPDVRDLHPLSCPVCGVTPALHGSRVHQAGSIPPCQGRGRLKRMLPGNGQVPQRGLELGMAHQTLDRMESHPGCSAMGRARVAQEMPPTGRGNAGTRCGTLETQGGGVAGERLRAVLAGKEPGGRTIDAPRGPQVLQAAWGPQGVAIFLARALFHPSAHPVAVAVGVVAMDACTRPSAGILVGLPPRLGAQRRGGSDPWTAIMAPEAAGPFAGLLRAPDRQVHH
jgi:hypothetical protein